CAVNSDAFILRQALTPDFTILIDKDEIGIGEKTFVQLINFSNIDYLEWSLGNGETSTEPSPEISYSAFGEYLISVTATNNTSGCEVTKNGIVTVTKDVNKETEVYLPSAFSPNGDGINDKLNIIAKNFQEFEMGVFNRWGGIIWGTTNTAIQWDGSEISSGNEAPAGVYIVAIRAVNNLGEPKIFKKVVTLTR
ncbi:MAG: gliding motility-associated-like protein, partial [Sphingobacteriales bacterium]